MLLKNNDSSIRALHTERELRSLSLGLDYMITALEAKELYMDGS